MQEVESCFIKFHITRPLHKHDIVSAHYAIRYLHPKLVCDLRGIDIGKLANRRLRVFSFHEDYIPYGCDGCEYG